jgi:RHS repeat-associated protein
MTAQASAIKSMIRMMIAFLITAIGLSLGTTAPVYAQSQEQLVYYHTDAVGSVRMITDANQQVVERRDYLPFGEPWPASPSSNDPAFGGKERDAETDLGYFEARYYATGNARFTSPDPITVNALRVVNPQRWNRYAYGINNPLKYTDPDGLDALLINFTDGAHGFGHMGMMALNPDGSGFYASFNPVTKGSPSDAGWVKNKEFPAGTVLFGAGGRLTIDSERRFREQLAKLDGKSPQAVRIRHIKTSLAETAALEAYIRQNIGAAARYNVISNNCQDFCIRGMQQAGIPLPPSNLIMGGLVPDLYFRSFLLDLAARQAEQGPTPRVDTSYCIHGIDCR